MKYIFNKLFFYIIISIAIFFLITDESNASIPNVLYKKDIENYQKIFSLQEKGRWTDADKVIKNIKAYLY